MTPEQSKLVEDNLHLVFLVAKKYIPQADSAKFEDNIAAGNLGLVKAALSYRSDGGASFATWAVSKIKGEIIEQWRLDYGRVVNGKRRIKPHALAHSIEVLAKDNGEFDIEDENSYCSYDIFLLHDLLSHLKSREHQIIYMHNIAGLTFKEIAAILRLSDSRVIQVAHRGMRRMRERVDEIKAGFQNRI